MYDIHCHLLPKIDDGAQSIDDSLKMCRAAAEDGVEGIIATPHYIDGIVMPTPSDLHSYIFLLENELNSEGINIKIYPGMEVRICPDLVQLYEKGTISALGCGRYMLIELPLFNVLPPYTHEVLFRLMLKGVRPVIAHPERYNTVINNMDIIRTLIDGGCIMQANTGSFLGVYGQTVRRTVNRLIRHGMVHVVASDAHNNKNHKDLSMQGCRRLIARRFGQALAEDLFVNNPLKVINGDPFYEI